MSESDYEDPWDGMSPCDQCIVVNGIPNCEDCDMEKSMRLRKRRESNCKMIMPREIG